MNVLLVSQCSGRALSETRRILDQFAERRGERTWQTPITKEGLDTLRRLLKKSARKNTAVACHWIRGRDHSELIWIVGAAGRFNAEGAVPTNTTNRDVIRQADENDWHTLEDIRLLAVLAALFHDVGKANAAFQKKLRTRAPRRDAYRHEWVSLRMFQAFVGDDCDRAWLDRLSYLDQGSTDAWFERLPKNRIDDDAPSPFKSLPPLAKAVGWLIVSHHFLPTQKDGLNKARLGRLPRLVTSTWNRADQDASDTEKRRCWTFEKGLGFVSKAWCEDAGRIARQMRERVQFVDRDWLANAYVSHMSRLSLMLADHYYSGRPANKKLGDANCHLFANTDGTELKQRLDEHLLGVGKSAGRIVRYLPQLADRLPRIARHKGFSRRSTDNRFRWQDKSYDVAVSLRRDAESHGFFGVNMASTGSGKTFANGRIMYGLADPKRGARFSIALGLRTLTLQTGEMYRNTLHLASDDLAVRVGGEAVRQLFERSRNEMETDTNERRGSESLEPLFPDTGYVHFEGALDDGPFGRWFEDTPDARRLLNAPILACTVDHLIPATEGTRGGRQIVPMLRLLTSDLVLDEPDDFDLDDLPALSRLVHWAGLLGSRVLLSSATLPPALVQGLFEAYLAGRSIFQGGNRGAPNLPVNICCAWFDEYGASPGKCANVSDFTAAHKGFVSKRLRSLRGESARRKAAIQPVSIRMTAADETLHAAWADVIHPLIHDLHARHHDVDPETGKRVSFGLVRMAHIDPLIDTAAGIFQKGAMEGFRIHLCCYHSRFPLVTRAGIEKQLDVCLNRRKRQEVFQIPQIRNALDRDAEEDHIFLVMATAVAEVGRDHDYDWAIVEPSSMRSIIQLAGRVMRHRMDPCELPNVYLLDTNLKSLKAPGQPAYRRPGFESESMMLASHRLEDILEVSQYQPLDAAPRVHARDPLDPRHNLVDLEHERLKMLMQAGYSDQTWSIDLFWSTSVHLTGVLQTKQRFRQQYREESRFVLVLDGTGGNYVFSRLERDGRLTPVQNLLHPASRPTGPRITSWGGNDYLSAIEELAEELEMDILSCARRFGYIDLDEQTQGWSYEPLLGMRRYSA